MPILSDASVGDPVNIGGDEIDGLAVALDLSKVTGEMTAEAQVGDNTITGRNNPVQVVGPGGAGSVG